MDWLAGDTDFGDAPRTSTHSWANAATIMNIYFHADHIHVLDHGYVVEKGSGV